ncbi:MAG: hypothetical protein ACLSH6_10590 [Limosilactobacillus pontis]
MEKKLVNVELTMENVEYWDIPAKYIRRFYCDDLRTALSLQEDINGHRDGRVSQNSPAKPWSWLLIISRSMLCRPLPLIKTGVKRVWRPVKALPRHHLGNPPLRQWRPG